MLDQKIIKTGSVKVSDSRIEVSGFEVDDATCREVAIHATIWAIGQLQEDLASAIAEAGAGKSCISD